MFSIASILGLSTQHTSAQRNMFPPNIFDLQLVEPAEAEPAATEGQLYDSRIMWKVFDFSLLSGM